MCSCRAGAATTPSADAVRPMVVVGNDDDDAALLLGGFIVGSGGAANADHRLTPQPLYTNVGEVEGHGTPTNDSVFDQQSSVNGANSHKDAQT
jgi:hypothetical protein